jgi:hypothetical protein
MMTARMEKLLVVAKQRQRRAWRFYDSAREVRADGTTSLAFPAGMRIFSDDA